MAWHIEGMANDVTTGRPLTPLQARFAVEYVANGGNGSKAALAAGYSDVSPGSEAYRLAHLPHVQAAIAAETLKQFGRHAPAAVDVLAEIMIDSDQPGGVRVKAAGMILDRAGFTPPKRHELESSRDKRPENMNKSELEAFIRRATSQLREASVPVLNAAVDAAGNAEVVDITDVDPA